MLLLVPEGRHQPCLAGCVLSVDRGLVAIAGKTRDAVFDQARRFFRVHARKLPAFTCAATLETPRHHGGGRDGWAIAVNSDVTFTVGGLAPDVRPALRVVGETEALAS